jgi:hypothetical protein
MFKKKPVLKVINADMEECSLPMDLLKKLSDLTQKFVAGSRTERELYWATDGKRMFTVTRVTHINTRDV